MKNLATCTPREFLKQTSLIRKSVEKWLRATDIMGIRKHLPDLEAVTPDMDAETREKIVSENRRKTEEQMNRNLSAMLDQILDEHPDETLELLALICFIDPKEVDDHPMSEYLGAVNEMISDKAVIGFFTSLAQLGLTSISNASKAQD